MLYHDSFKREIKQAQARLFDLEHEAELRAEQEVMQLCRIKEKIIACNPEQMRPVEALALLDQLKETIDS